MAATRVAQPVLEDVCQSVVVSVTGGRIRWPDEGLSLDHKNRPVVGIHKTSLGLRRVALDSIQATLMPEAPALPAVDSGDQVRQPIALASATFGQTYRIHVSCEHTTARGPDGVVMAALYRSR